MITVDDPIIRDTSIGMTVGAPGTLPFATLSIDNHVSAVVVFGETQDEADARAWAIWSALRKRSIK